MPDDLTSGFSNSSDHLSTEERLQANLGELNGVLNASINILNEAYDALYLGADDTPKFQHEALTVDSDPNDIMGVWRGTEVQLKMAIAECTNSFCDDYIPGLETHLQQFGPNVEGGYQELVEQVARQLSGIDIGLKPDASLVNNMTQEL